MKSDYSKKQGGRKDQLGNPGSAENFVQQLQFQNKHNQRSREKLFQVVPGLAVFDGDTSGNGGMQAPSQTHFEHDEVNSKPPKYNFNQEIQNNRASRLNREDSGGRNGGNPANAGSQLSGETQQRGSSANYRQKESSLTRYIIQESQEQLEKNNFQGAAYYLATRKKIRGNSQFQEKEDLRSHIGTCQAQASQSIGHRTGSVLVQSDLVQGVHSNNQLRAAHLNQYNAQSQVAQQYPEKGHTKKLSHSHSTGPHRERVTGGNPAYPFNDEMVGMNALISPPSGSLMQTNMGAYQPDAKAHRVAAGGDLHEDVYMTRQTAGTKARKLHGHTASVDAAQATYSHDQQINQLRALTSGSPAPREQSNKKRQINHAQVQVQQMDAEPRKQDYTGNSGVVSQRPQNLKHPVMTQKKRDVSTNQANFMVDYDDEGEELYIPAELVRPHDNKPGLELKQREIETLAEKLNFQTSQVFHSKLKSKSELAQSLKVPPGVTILGRATGYGGAVGKKAKNGLRKSVKSPAANGSTATLQEPSAKALPTSSIVKLSQKFNTKFDHSNANKGHHSSKGALFTSTKQNKKTVACSSSTIKLFEFQEKHGGEKTIQFLKNATMKNSSQSYATLPKNIVNAFDSKISKKLKSPSPQGQGLEIEKTQALERMKSPLIFLDSNPKSSLSTHGEGLAHLIHTIKESATATNSQSKLNLFDSRRLSQQPKGASGIKLSDQAPGGGVPTSTNVHSNSLSASDGFSILLKKKNSVSLATSNQKQSQNLMLSTSPEEQTKCEYGSKLVGQQNDVSQFLNDQQKNMASSQIPSSSFNNANRGSIDANSNSVGNQRASTQNLREPIDEAKQLQGKFDARKQSLNSQDQVQMISKLISKAKVLSDDEYEQTLKQQKHVKILSESPIHKKNTKHAVSQLQLVNAAQQQVLQQNGSTNKIVIPGCNVKQPQKFVQQMQTAYFSANIAATNEKIGVISPAQKALLNMLSTKQVSYVQSPLGSLGKAAVIRQQSPKSPGKPKASHKHLAGIQTCKVNIADLALSKQSTKDGNQSGQVVRTLQQALTKAKPTQSKEYLKTIKLFKRGGRGSNSSSPVALIKQGDISPTSQNQPVIGKSSSDSTSNSLSTIISQLGLKKNTGETKSQQELIRPHNFKLKTTTVATIANGNQQAKDTQSQLNLLQLSDISANNLTSSVNTSKKEDNSASELVSDRVQKEKVLLKQKTGVDGQTAQKNETKLTKGKGLKVYSSLSSPSTNQLPLRLSKDQVNVTANSTDQTSQKNSTQSSSKAQAQILKSLCQGTGPFSYKPSGPSSQGIQLQNYVQPISFQGNIEVNINFLSSNNHPQGVQSTKNASLNSASTKQNTKFMQSQKIINILSPQKNKKRKDSQLSGKLISTSSSATKDTRLKGLKSKSKLLSLNGGLLNSSKVSSQKTSANNYTNNDSSRGSNNGSLVLNQRLIKQGRGSIMPAGGDDNIALDFADIAINSPESKGKTTDKNFSSGIHKQNSEPESKSSQNQLEQRSSIVLLPPSQNYNEEFSKSSGLKADLRLKHQDSKHNPSLDLVPQSGVSGSQQSKQCKRQKNVSQPQQQITDQSRKSIQDGPVKKGNPISAAHFQYNGKNMVHHQPTDLLQKSKGSSGQQKDPHLHQAIVHPSKPYAVQPVAAQVGVAPMKKNLKDYGCQGVGGTNAGNSNDKKDGDALVFNNEGGAKEQQQQRQKANTDGRLHFKNYQLAPPSTIDQYRIGRVLGRGAFGKVSLAMHKQREQLVAIKSMVKEDLQNQEDLRRRTELELGILKQCNHCNVVRLYDQFETSKHICFVIELCSGGDLFSYIKKRRRLKEDVAKFFFKQLVEGLAYIHNAKKVIHRDIKLENVLLDATGTLKICDFGVSRQIKKEGETMTQQCGTPAYIAPEILRNKGYSGFKADMWSAGVCLYAMLIGTVPFKASSMTGLQKLILAGKYDLRFQTAACSNKINNPNAAMTLLSENVQDLIAKLLNTDPAKRLSAIEALQHPWFSDYNPNLDIYTEKEKNLIQKEYTRLNLKKQVHDASHQPKHSQSNKHLNQVLHSEILSNNDTENLLFTEHALETRNNDEDKDLQNNDDKSHILAPFNSLNELFVENGQPLMEEKKGSPPFQWPKEVLQMIRPRKVIQFSAKCREKNRAYMNNNNAELDNGVYNEFVNEQEREEGQLANEDTLEDDRLNNSSEGVLSQQDSAERFKKLDVNSQPGSRGRKMELNSSNEEQDDSQEQDEEYDDDQSNNSLALYSQC